jgi:hypothetical protein
MSSTLIFNRLLCESSMYTVLNEPNAFFQHKCFYLKKFGYQDGFGKIFVKTSYFLC